MSEEEQDIHMVLLGPGYKPQESMVPGSIKTKADCTHDAWISPSMRKNVAAWKEGDIVVQTICEDCAMKNEELAETMLTEGVFATKETEEELKKHGIDVHKEAARRGVNLKVLPRGELPTEVKKVEMAEAKVDVVTSEVTSETPSGAPPEAAAAHEAVADRDGGTIMYNPAAVGVQPPENPGGNTPWYAWWCSCGHLVVDHHFSPEDQDNDAMQCWAKDCDCFIGLGKA